jgi:hypothetical protein
MTDQPTTPTESAEQRRADVVAGIRALADFLESNPDLPVPNSIHAQHSIYGDLDDAGRDLIRSVGEKLELTEGELGATSYMRFDPNSASARYQLTHGYDADLGSYHVTYVVHGAVREAGDDA